MVILLDVAGELSTPRYPHASDLARAAARGRPSQGVGKLRADRVQNGLGCIRMKVVGAIPRTGAAATAMAVRTARMWAAAAAAGQDWLPVFASAACVNAGAVTFFLLRVLRYGRSAWPVTVGPRCLSRKSQKSHRRIC